MEIKVTFPGNKKVNAQFNGFEVRTDQPAPTGEGSAPTPFDYFLASIGTCAGIFVVSFCQKRQLSTEGLEITQKVETDPETHKVKKISIEITAPKDFPEKYLSSLISTANLCSVKKTIADPPEFEITTKTFESRI